jgi:hypothetical protein
MLPSATVSRVEEDIVEMKSICKDSQNQISRLSLEVEEERSQRSQIKAEYETQLVAVTSKNGLKLESILNKIHSKEHKQASLHEKAIELIELLQKHSHNVTAYRRKPMQYQYQPKMRQKQRS